MRDRLLRVLVSARDPGSAAHLQHVIPALAADTRLCVTGTASGAAQAMLATTGIDLLPFALPDRSAVVPAGGDTTALLAAADALLARVQPDTILVGISSLGVGVDEALLARAGGRPTFALQDYPGDANAIDACYAALYFVRDEAAAALTRRRFGVATLPIGSPRHAAYARLDVAELRRRTRGRAGAAEGQPVLGFFGQPPEIPGHEAAFEHLVEALAGRQPAPLVVLREHPKAPETRTRHLAVLRAAGLPTHDATGIDAVEPWLAACDLVTTSFSQCTMDYAFLSAWSAAPLGAVLFVMTTPEIRRFLREYAGVDAPDGVAAGLGEVARTAADVRPLLDALLTPAAARAYHAAAARLPRRADVAAIVNRVVLAARAAADAS